MPDFRATADDAVHHLDRLAAVALDDVGDGPAPANFAAHALRAHTAVALLGASALTELTGLMIGVGDSLVAGVTDWSPSLGGTLMAAVDDLRALITRAGDLTTEDSEHLHQRAVDLSEYVRVPRVQVIPPAAPPPPAPAAAPTPAPMASSNPAPPAAAPTAPAESRVSISDFFYAEGPQVVKGGVPKAAESASDILGASIDALDNLQVESLSAPLESATTVLPVDSLVYRGRPALERAAALREQIKASGSAASPAALDEMYDLIDLALKD